MLPISFVDAAGAFTRGDPYCYNSKGEYTQTSTSCPANNTYYKEIDGKKAYCVQAGINVPKSGVTYSVIKYGTTVAGQKWTEDKAMRAAEIIKRINNLDVSSKEKYVYTFAALNNYLKFNAHKNFTSGVINDIIDKVKKMDFYTGSNVYGDSISVTFSNGSNILSEIRKNNTTYYYSTIKVAMKNSYSSGKVSYSLSSCTNCKVYSDSSFKTQVGVGSNFSTLDSGVEQTKTFYIVANQGVDLGSTVTAKFTANASHTYYLAKLWKYSSALQMVVTRGDEKTYPHVENASISGRVPTNTPSIYVEKVDPNGDSLAGSNIAVSVAGQNCIINGTQSSCQISLKDNPSSVDYTIREISAPSGFVKIPDIKKTWPIGQNTSTCYYSEDGQWKNSSDVNECTKYSTGEICYNKTKESRAADYTDRDSCILHSNEPDSEDEFEWKSVCLENKTSVVADEKCSRDQYIITTSGKTLSIDVLNNYNVVRIGKQNMNGEGVSDASLKVCTKSAYESKSMECDSYVTKNGVQLEWLSSSSSSTFRGFEVGTYYLIEVEPAPGYLSTKDPVIFSVDADGKVKLEDGSNPNGDVIFDEEKSEYTVILKNDTTGFFISKQDIATQKELPGASIRICEAANDFSENDHSYGLVVDEAGNCEPVVLADGSFAAWESGDTPHLVVGLDPGTYYLVETQAPNGFSTAESVLFTLNNDGTLSGKDGKPLAEKKLIMYDNKISDVKTGLLSLYIIFGTLALVIALGGGSYYYMKKVDDTNLTSIHKIRKRKIHKS